jgi:signal transduction histidine kinase/ligand-binding sensor domain-containing protein
MLSSARRCLPLLLLLALATPALALDPNRTLTQAFHRIWQPNQGGLPEATIYRIRQTTDGYLWLGTQTGLARFDGVRFVQIGDLGPHISLRNTWVHDLLEDRSGNLWIATDGVGLIRLKDGVARRFGLADGLVTLTIQALLCDSRGLLYAATPAGLARLERDRFVTLTGLPFNDVRGLAQASDGSLWLSGPRGELAVSNVDTSQSSNIKFETLPLNHTAALALLGTQDGAVWIGTNDGLLRRAEGQVLRLSKSDGLADDTVYCLTEAADGSVWAGTRDGLSRIRRDGHHIDSFRSTDGLSQSTVYTLCEDREGSIWAGTKHGLDQFVDRRTLPFTASEGLPSNNTGPVSEVGTDAHDASIWVGTLGAGLSRFDGHRFLPALTSRDGLPSDDIFALAGDRQGDLWAGTDRGLAHLHEGRVARTYATPADGLPSPVIRCVTSDIAGRLWVGTNAGIARLEPDRPDRFVAIAAGAPELKGVWAMFARRDGSLVISAGDALLVIRDERVEPFAAAPLASGAKASAFLEDADGTLWITTRGGGLIAVAPSNATISRYTAHEGLYDDDLFAIVADDTDHLWLSCSKGIFSVARADLRAFSAGSAKTIPCVPFSPMEALRTIECRSGVQPGACRARSDGRLWFSTIRGVIVVDPNHLQRRQTSPPPVVIEEVTVNGETYPRAEIGTLRPGLRNVEFRYTALSLQSPVRTTFHYKLEGFDKDWIDAGPRREAFYTNLPPSHYRFRVMATTADGASAEAGNAVAFTLTPYFYQRPWFVPICLALLAALALAAFRTRLRRLRAQASAVLGERSRIARELHDTLMQGFSGVTMEMQALAHQLAPSKQRDTLQDIIRDAGACLRDARRSVAGLRAPSNGTAAAAAGPIAARSKLPESLAQVARQIIDIRDVKLKLRLRSDAPPLPPEVEYNLVRIAQEAITNSIKHSGCRSVEVALEGDAHQLVLAVRDDGSGIPASAAEIGVPGHYGLIGMRERAAQIGANLTIDGHSARGTRVELRLAINANANANGNGDGNGRGGGNHDSRTEPATSSR